MLYRVFYYDARPFENNATLPITKSNIDFILDPMWRGVSPDLFEHIDGMWSGLPRTHRCPHHTTDDP